MAGRLDARGGRGIQADMGKQGKTGISWTYYTFNPWWGCVPVSEECDHCYARRLAHRLGYNLFNGNGLRRSFPDKHWDLPHTWNRKAQKENRRLKVFCGSMCDVFEDHPGLMMHRARLWELIESTSYLDWMLLTKRPENALNMVPPGWSFLWPQNIWFGFTAGNQKRLLERYPHAVKIPTLIHFISMEPLLGPIDFYGISQPFWNGVFCKGIDWVVVGGESGPGARPTHPGWVRSIIQQCQSANVPVHVKQIHINGKASKNPEEWPEDLRIRELPRV